VDEDTILILATNAWDRADLFLPDRLAGILFADKQP
jgi:hypothetical protein